MYWNRLFNTDITIPNALTGNSSSLGSEPYTFWISVFRIASVCCSINSPFSSPSLMCNSPLISCTSSSEHRSWLPSRERRSRSLGGLGVLLFCFFWRLSRRLSLRLISDSDSLSLVLDGIGVLCLRGDLRNGVASFS